MSTSRLIATAMIMGGTPASVTRASPSRVNNPAASPRTRERARRVDALAADRILIQNMQQSVLELREDSRPGNTSKAMDPKVVEFFQYCDLVYPNQMYKYVLNFDKVQKFMWYQMMRPQRKRGGSAAEKAARENGNYFNLEEYNELIADFSEDPQAWQLKFTASVVDKEKKPCGPSTFSMYKAVFRKIFRVQKAKDVLASQWDDIWLEPLEELWKHVQERAPMAKKNSYAEKLDAEFAPYTTCEHCPAIEEALWNDSHSVGERSISGGLRHRYCFTQLSTAVLRSESLHRAELSDLCGVGVPKTELDIHELWLMILRIAIGKTTHGIPQYGRATRHRDVRLCCCGSNSFYLQHRFDQTRELEDMPLEDWLENHKWFDIKLLIDLQNGKKDNTKQMKSDTYAKHLRKVLDNLGLSCNKLLHLGRNLGAKMLELLEEEQDAINNMGQWAKGMQQKCYSTKLPIKPIKKLAGYHGDSKMYFNTRTTVQPSDELLRMTPIGRFAYKAYDYVCEHTDVGECNTAKMTLLFFQKLNEVFLQDAAAMMVLHKERENHPIFNMDVFKSTEFHMFKGEMKSALENEECPLDADLDKVLPKVRDWHRSNDLRVKTLAEKVDRLDKTMQSSVKNLQAAQRHARADSDKRLAASFLQVASSLLSGNTKLQEEEELGESNSFESESSSPSPVEAAVMDFGAPKDGMANGCDVQMEEVTTTPARTTAPAGTISTVDKNSWNKPVHLEKKMRKQHSSLVDMYDEWVGQDFYADEFGGIEGRDKLFKAKWRKHISPSLHSKTKRVIQAIRNHANTNRVSVTESCIALQTKFVDCNYSVANLVRVFQEEGYLTKKKTRGRHAVPSP